MVPASLFSFLLGGPDIVFHMIKLLHRHAKEQTILCSMSEYIVVNSKGMYLAVGEGIEVEYYTKCWGLHMWIVYICPFISQFEG